MRVLPILFSTDMVRAILDGRKTVTRRVVKPRMPDHCPGCMHIHSDFIYDKAAQNVYCASCGEFLNNGGFPYKPPYQPGDILYVRETWAYHKNAEGGIIFRARCPKKLAKTKKWRSSIHMPKKAARIWLKVTNVRVERLWDIRDLRAEGIHTSESCDECFSVCGGCDPDSSPTGCDNEIEKFAELWDSTVKKVDIDRYGWDANPWVWVIEFERCEKPEENESAGSSEWKDNFMQRFCKVN